MLTDGPHHLLIITGDHDTQSFSQDPESHFGKLVRTETVTGHAQILASGFRNPQGMARDQYGNLWGTDHGPRGGDELNLLVQGNNYGWPIVSYGINDRGYINLPEGQENRMEWHDGFTAPAFSWIQSIGISDIIMNDDQEFQL